MHSSEFLSRYVQQQSIMYCIYFESTLRCKMQKDGQRKVNLWVTWNLCTDSEVTEVTSQNTVRLHHCIPARSI
jgi:hypothetical protein